MTTPAGQIAMSDVNVELNYAYNRVNSSLNDGTVRVLAQVSSGQISMANLRSKTNSFSLTIGDAQNANLRTIANNNGYQNQPIVYLTLVGTMYSYATGSPACYAGAWPAGTRLTIELRGTIQGYGGAGGGGAGASGGAGGGAGGAGGYAMYFDSGISGGSITFYVNGGWTYAGGGGGGGGGAGSFTTGGSETVACNMAAGGAGGHGQGWSWGQGAGAAGAGSPYGSGAGGWGGGWGAAGAAGAGGTRPTACNAQWAAGPGGGGGAAGYAYGGWGNVSSYIGNTGNYSGSVG